MLTQKIEKIYSEFITKRSYSRWLESENRRETWNETVDRYRDFFLPRVPKDMIPAFLEAIEGIRNHEVVPSMRALWSAGPALEKHNIAAYNCAYTHIESISDFVDILYILMHGAGMGYSVERQYITKLPLVPEDLIDVPTVIEVADSKEGWAMAFRELLNGIFDEGKVYDVDYSKVRPKGARLMTFGGRASGPEPLKQLFDFAVKLCKKAKGRQLNSIECHDLATMIANCVISGGVRRSAMISFSNLSDQRMKHAKDGQFWIENPQRSFANNSIAYTEKPDSGIFLEEWLNLIRSGSGERGIFNAEGIRRKQALIGRDPKADYRANPCVEAVLKNKQFCNLSEVIIRPDDTKETLMKKIEYAVILGLLQASLTDFKFISPKWKESAEEETMLGVSLTGIADNKLFKKVDEKTKMLISDLRSHAKLTAFEYASILGLKKPNHCTVLKPSGCTSLETEIKTDLGILSMREIFEMNEVDTNNLEGFECIWLDPKKKMFVFDENNDKQEITKLFINGSSEVYEIEFEDGNVYSFTPEHKLKTKSGWKMVCELSESDEIISF